jgi:hypothetical protein
MTCVPYIWQLPKKVPATQSAHGQLVHVLDVMNGRHIPPKRGLHTSLAAHVFPHMPQFCESVVRSTHAPSAPPPTMQRLSPPLHAVAQVPLLQSAPVAAVQRFVAAVPPHAVGLVMVFTHVPVVASIVRPGRHTQLPPTHACRLVHCAFAVPQWFGSVLGSTHAPPTIMRGAAHVHVLATQLAPPGQRMPQLPQWAADVVVSTQPLPPQSIVPVGHAHCPDTHDAPIGHALLHVPQ